MARLSFANAMAGIRNAFGAGGQLRAKDQLSAVVDALLQMAGNANIAPGNTEPADPLNSPFTIYVDPYIGSDRFVGGSYNWFEEAGGAPEPARIAAKLRRLENQRLTCGYSKERPFRTLNRAAIEIVLATSKSFFTINSEAANVDCPSVELSAGTHILYNDPGNSPSAIAISEWPAAGFEPTPQHLIAFNPNSGGIVIPRYATVSAPLSLRQCTVRPSFVPAAADEALNYSNRAAILKITSSSYIYGFTFRDALGASASHHLLDCFHNASQADLDQLYSKVRTAMGGANNTGNISNSLAVTRPTEWQTVGPISGNPSEAWDTVKGASPYVYNCSLRTEWGMSGVFWDGARLAGLKSFVAAQFTGISQQRDLSCWEIYRSGAWRAPVTYQELIDSESDDVRMRPRRMSRHITLLNDAFGQLVSVFAIGAGRHHFADSGAQMEFSNSTSNFGGCVAVARGYQTSSVPLDSSWNLRRLKAARSVADQTGNIRRIPLGIVASISGSTIVLQAPLAASADPAVPAVLAASGYSLPAGTLVWIENPTGVDWRATLAANAWSSSAATEIDITGAAVQAGTGAAIGTGAGGASNAIGKRVYVRRLIDTRTAAQRRVTLKLANTTSARVPLRNSILQTRPGVQGGGIDRALAAGGAEVLAVTQTTGIPPEGAGVVLSAEITIRRSCPDEVYASGVFYRQGQTVKFGGKHFTAKGTFISSGSTPEEGRWQESYVQQESAYNAEDPTTLEAPVLIFDTDTDAATDVTTSCGINWSTVYTASGSVRDQLRSATDYRGALALLLALGFNSTAAHNALVPRPESGRELDPASATDFPTPPSGGAASGRANWAIEFRQPSFVQLLGHNFNGVGFWNYSRALPRARRQLSALNEFNANFTPEQGGRVEVRGINKDGFEVTNVGLINTDTGEVVAVEGIGAESDQALPTQLANLAVENLSISGALDVSGVSTLTGGEAIALRTDRFGVGQLATFNDLVTITQAAANDEEINAAADKLLALPGLNRVLAERRYVQTRTSTVVIYIDPVNGVGSTTNQNDAINTFFASEPNTINNAARSLRFAAEYVGLLYSPQTRVEYRLLPGLYLDRTARFRTLTHLRAWNPSTDTELFNTSGNSTGKDFYDHVTNPVTRYDPALAPCFPCHLQITLTNFGGIVAPLMSPYQISAEQPILIDGLVWWDIHQSLTAAVPNGFHTAITIGGTLPVGQSIDVWRAGESFADVLNTVLSCACAYRPGGATDRLLLYTAQRAVLANQYVQLRNVAFGAYEMVGDVGPNAVNKGTLIDSPVVSFRGLYLIGNCQVSGAAATAKGGVPWAWARTLAGLATRQGVGFVSYVFGNTTSPSEGVAINAQTSRACFYPAGSIPPNSTLYNGIEVLASGTASPATTFDAPFNNLFLLNNAGAWDIGASQEWNLQGPAVLSVFAPSNLLTGSGRDAFPPLPVPPPGQNIWWQFTSTPTTPATQSGIKGRLGVHRSVELFTGGAQAIQFPRGISIPSGAVQEFPWNPSYNDSDGKIVVAADALSFWSIAGALAAAGRQPRWIQPSGPGRTAIDYTVSVNNSTTFTLNGHPFIVNDILVAAQTLAGITAGQLLYVTSIATNTFTVTLIPGGPNFTTTGGAQSPVLRLAALYWPQMNMHTVCIRAGIDGTGLGNAIASRNFVY
jgi:hypothetical protein